MAGHHHRRAGVPQAGVAVSMLVAAGSTSVTTYFALRLAADDTAATGLTITNFDLQYVRSGTAPVAKVDATALAATDSVWDDNKAIEVDATNQPGLYRVDWPDAAFAAGVREVILTVKVATAKTKHLRVTINAQTVVTSLGAQAKLDVNTEVDNGIETYKLDHLIAVADSDDPVNGSIIAEMVSSTGDWSTFDATASLQALKGLITTVDTVVDTLDTLTKASGPGDLAAILLDTGTTLQGELDGIQADTENIQSRLPTSLVNSRMDSTIDASGFEQGAIDNVWDEALSGHTTVGTGGKQIGDMTYTNSNELDVNTKSINDAEVTGSGTVADPWNS